MCRKLSQCLSARNLIKAIAKMKSSKSFGNDSISSYFLKLALPYIKNSLVLLLSTSIESSQFPDKWKVAGIPLFLRTCKENYRPTSVLPVVARLFEELIFDQLYNYLNKDNLIYWGHSAHRKLLSTVTCLVKTPINGIREWIMAASLGKFS